MSLSKKMAAIRQVAKCTQENIRGFSTTSICNGLKNFRKIVLNKRGGMRFRERIEKNPDPDIPVNGNMVRLSKQEQ